MTPEVREHARRLLAEAPPFAPETKDRLRQIFAPVVEARAAKLRSARPARRRPATRAA